MSEQPTEYGKEPIEAGARAMHERNRIHQTADCLATGHAPPDRAEFTPWDELSEDARNLRRDIFRAALLAAFAKLREPSGGMKDAGADTYGVGNSATGSLPLAVLDGQPTKAFRAMLSQLLTEIET